MSDRKVLQVRLVSLGDGDGIPERRVLLAAGQDVTIGRASSNRGVAASADNTKINNPVISKEHATFTTDASGTTVFIRDLRSMHGTRVNDRELSQGESCAIFPGSALQFGSTVIRGNATFKPAKYTFYVEPVNPANAFSNATSTTMPVEAPFDLKKGYCDDSSLYSDDYDSQEDDYLSNLSQADKDVIQDTYTSERDSDPSLDDSDHSSSEETNESDGSEDMSVEDYCSTDSACPATDVQEADVGSTAVVEEQTSFCSSYLDGSDYLLKERMLLDCTSEPPMGVAHGEWPENTDAEQSVYFTSTSADPTSETAEHMDFNMDIDQPQPWKSLKPGSGGHNKSRPFSNSINELCEPVPEVDVAALEADTSNDDPAQGTPNVGSSSVVDTTLFDADEPERMIASIKFRESMLVESTRSKRSAEEAELDAGSIPEPAGLVKANQIATPEQMSNRRIASITRRARDLSIGVVVGGVAVFTVLASMGDGA